MQIALKIDVDTYVGMRDGLPAIVRTLERRGIRGSFFVACGPDHTGRALRRLFRPGFLRKVLRTEVSSTVGWRTLLYGTLLPGPQIARSFAESMRSLAANGHEVGVHGYDHVYWQDRLDRLSDREVAVELARGLSTFREILGVEAQSFAAPGWQCTAASLAAIDAAGLGYHSCTRGLVPYLPRAGGRTFRTLEIPTSLPTLDEVYGVAATDGEGLTRFYLEQLRSGLNVHTIHTEVEGMAQLGLFERLLDALAEKAEFVRLIDVAANLEKERLPTCLVEPRAIAGRAGTVATQILDGDLREGARR